MKYKCDFCLSSHFRTPTHTPSRMQISLQTSTHTSTPYKLILTNILTSMTNSLTHSHINIEAKKGKTHTVVLCLCHFFTPAHTSSHVQISFQTSTHTSTPYKLILTNILTSMTNSLTHSHIKIEAKKGKTHTVVLCLCNFFTPAHTSSHVKNLSPHPHSHPHSLIRYAVSFCVFLISTRQNVRY